MKKYVIALWIVAALFLVSAFPMFAEGNIGAGVAGIVLAAVLAYVGYSKQRKANQVAEEEARRLAEEEARKAEFAAKHGVLSLAVAGVTFDNRQRILASLYKESDGIGINGTLEENEYEGERACRVYAEGEIIGYIRKSDLPDVLPILDRIEDVTLTIDNFTDDGQKIYNVSARITYAK